MKTSVLIMGLGLALASSGCATHKIQYRNPGATANGTVHSSKQSFFLWGLAGGSEVDLARVCPDGVASIESKTSPVDSILHWMTGGLYSPMTVDMRCAGGGTAGVAGGEP